MSDSFTKQPDQNVIDALNAAYRPTLTAFEQFHRQEHRFHVKYRYKKLECRYDKLVHCAREWRRCILNRIERLGGDVDSTMGPIAVMDEIAPAFQATHDALYSIYSAIGQAIATALSANDHPTHKILMHIQAHVDHKMCKVEAWQRVAKEVGENYVITLV